MKTFFFLFLSVLSFTIPPPENTIPIDAYSSETVITIKLNDGEKWKADAATTASIEKLQEICNTHFNEKTVDDELLKETLTTEVDKLNRVSKLTGNARSQLHNYQMGIRSRINTISQDRESIMWLMDYLETYYTYFN